MKNSTLFDCAYHNLESPPTAAVMSLTVSPSFGKTASVSEERLSSPSSASRAVRALGACPPPVRLLQQQPRVPLWLLHSVAPYLSTRDLYHWALTCRSMFERLVGPYDSAKGGAETKKTTSLFWKSVLTEECGLPIRSVQLLDYQFTKRAAALRWDEIQMSLDDAELQLGGDDEDPFEEEEDGDETSGQCCDLNAPPQRWTPVTRSPSPFYEHPQLPLAPPPTQPHAQSHHHHYSAAPLSPPPPMMVLLGGPLYHSSGAASPTLRRDPESLPRLQQASPVFLGCGEGRDGDGTPSFLSGAPEEDQLMQTMHNAPSHAWRDQSVSVAPLEDGFVLGEEGEDDVLFINGDDRHGAGMVEEPDHSAVRTACCTPLARIVRCNPTVVEAAFCIGQSTAEIVVEQESTTPSFEGMSAEIRREVAAYRSVVDCDCVKEEDGSSSPTDNSPAFPWKEFSRKLLQCRVLGCQQKIHERLEQAQRLVDSSNDFENTDGVVQQSPLSDALLLLNTNVDLILQSSANNCATHLSHLVARPTDTQHPRNGAVTSSGAAPLLPSALQTERKRLWLTQTLVLRAAAFAQLGRWEDAANDYAVVWFLSGGQDTAIGNEAINAFHESAGTNQAPFETSSNNNSRPPLSSPFAQAGLIFLELQQHGPSWRRYIQVYFLLAGSFRTMEVVWLRRALLLVDSLSDRLVVQTWISLHAAQVAEQQRGEDFSKDRSLASFVEHQQSFPLWEAQALGHAELAVSLLPAGVGDSIDQFESACRSAVRDLKEVVKTLRRVGSRNPSLDAAHSSGHRSIRFSQTAATRSTVDTLRSAKQSAQWLLELLMPNTSLAPSSSGIEEEEDVSTTTTDEDAGVWVDRGAPLLQSLCEEDLALLMRTSESTMDRLLPHCVKDPYGNSSSSSSAFTAALLYFTVGHAAMRMGHGEAAIDAFRRVAFCADVSRAMVAESLTLLCAVRLERLPHATTAAAGGSGSSSDGSAYPTGGVECGADVPVGVRLWELAAVELLLRRSLRLNPSDYRTYCALSICLQKQHAARMQHQSSSEQPLWLGSDDDPRLLQNQLFTLATANCVLHRAEALVERSRYVADPVPDLDAATALQPQLSHPYRLRAALLMDRGAPDEAITELSRVVALTGDPADVSLRGFFYRDMGRVSEALQDLSFAVALQPCNDELREAMLRMAVLPTTSISTAGGDSPSATALNGPQIALYRSASSTSTAPSMAPTRSASAERAFLQHEVSAAPSRETSPAVPPPLQYRTLLAVTDGHRRGGGGGDSLRLPSTLTVTRVEGGAGASLSSASHRSSSIDPEVVQYTQLPSSSHHGIPVSAAVGATAATAVIVELAPMTPHDQQQQFAMAPAEWTTTGEAEGMSVTAVVPEGLLRQLYGLSTFQSDRTLLRQPQQPPRSSTVVTTRSGRTTATAGTAKLRRGLGGPNEVGARRGGRLPYRSCALLPSSVGAGGMHVRGSSEEDRADPHSPHVMEEVLGGFDACCLAGMWPARVMELLRSTAADSTSITI